MYKLCFLVPETDVEAVKAAIFAAGAGRIGHYENCCWQTPGEGQFRPLAGSQPHIGSQDTLSTVREFKIECQVASEQLHEVVAALRSAHPYEEPVIDVWQLTDV